MRRSVYRGSGSGSGPSPVFQSVRLSDGSAPHPATAAQPSDLDVVPGWVSTNSKQTKQPGKIVGLSTIQQNKATSASHNGRATKN